MDYLTLFSPHNLALLSDWLQETGELYLDWYTPHGGSSSTAFLVRTIQELKSLFSGGTWTEIDLTIFHTRQFPLRGIANDALLEQALQLIPDGALYSIVSIDPNEHPCRLNFRGDGRSHEQFRREFAESLNDEVGIGQEPILIYDGDWINAHADEVFEVSIYRNNQFQVKKNQDYYAPYAQNPAKYQWLIDLWNAE